jgi:ankyrin repeat protein
MRKRTSGWLSISLSMVLIVVLAGWGQAAGDGALVAAARDGDLQAVRALIAKRANINEPARDGSTALLWAAYHSNVDMVRALVAAGAKVDVANK